MTFLDDVKDALEKLKRKFGISWQKLLEQIPDTDRLESYRYDEVLKQYVLKSTMPEPEVPILDENRNLKVEIPNFKIIDIEIATGDAVSFWEYNVELDFLADSITVAMYDMSMDSGTGYYINYCAKNIDGSISQIDADIELYPTTPFSDVITQYDIKPFNRFQINYIKESTDDACKMKFIFSKQKKTKISDLIYNATNWNAVKDIGASKNAIRDKIVLMDVLIDANLTQTELISYLGDIGNIISIGKLKLTLCNKVIDCIRITSDNDPNALLTDEGIRTYVDTTFSTLTAILSYLSNINNTIEIGKLKLKLCDKVIDCIRTTSDNDPNALLTDAGIKSLIDSKISDIAYNESTWNAVTTIAPSKNAVRDILEAILTWLVSDVAYNESTWNGVIAIAPSKNVIRDKLEAMDTLTETEILALEWVEEDITDLDHDDTDAIHGNRDSEISAIAEKETLHDDDMFLIEDSEDDDNKKMVKRVRFGGISGSKITLPLQIINATATETGGDYLLDASGELIYVHFWADIDTVDTDKDILFTWIIYGVDTDATLVYRRYQGAVKTGNDEAIAWNIANNVQDTFNIVATRVRQVVFTFDAADIDGDDHLRAIVKSEDVSDFRVSGCYVTFYLK